MQWEAGVTAGFSTCDPSKLYLPIDPDPKRPTVAGQINDPHSILNCTKGLLALRSSVPALGNTGGWKLVSDPQQAYPAIYERSDNHSKYLVIINPREKNATALIGGYDQLEIIWGDPKSLSIKKSKGKLSLKIQGISSVICKVL
jgi:maltose alpha-D-glucosyltransferase/alpha-amylase